MGFTFANLKRALLFAVALIVAFTAAAQRSTNRPLQPILFSTPASDTASTNTPSLSPQPSQSLDFGSKVKAPSEVDFSGPVVETPLPASPAAVARNDASLTQELLDRRKNWLLLTPAEILGVDTPEKILGIREHDEFGRPKSSTAVERYLERQNQNETPPAGANTNTLPAWNLFEKPSNLPSLQSGGFGSPDNLPALLPNPVPDNQIGAGQNAGDSWTKLFDTPPPSLVVTTAQQTDMERFRQLLKSGSSPTVVPETPALSGAKRPLPQTALSSGLGQSALSPIGAAFTPLNIGIGKPAELPKLPSIWSQSWTSPPSAAVWAPQPPPWLSPTPQPFTPPQRKF